MTVEEFRAWAATRKNPGKDINGPAQKFTDKDVQIKNGGNSCKDDLRHIIFQIMKLRPVEEFQFAKPRRFRFDFCFPDKMVAIEYEGIISVKSDHTTIKGYTSNCEKYNLAAKRGWKLLRYTALNYKEVMIDLPELLLSDS